MFKKLKNDIKSFFTIKTKATFMVVLIAMAGMSTAYSLRKAIVISIDGNEKQIITFKKDLKSVLTKERIVIGPRDKITPDISSFIKDGDRVTIKKAVRVHLYVDGMERQLSTSEDTIEDMLKLEGITVGALDKISPSPRAAPSRDMTVSITRVETRLLKEYTPIDFSTVVKNDDSLLNTVKKVAQEGEAGERETTFHIVYENGKEASRRVLQELITKQPIQKVILQGTLSALKLSRGGQPYIKETFSRSTPQDLAYKSVLTCVATAYSAEEPGLDDKTATGTTVKRDPNGYSTIATDPRVIPMGTRVYVENYGYAIAEDVGGAIKGNIIDVYFHTVADCNNWGRRTVKVYILP